jgi:hypothetical protein
LIARADYLLLAVKSSARIALPNRFAPADIVPWRSRFTAAFLGANYLGAYPP